MKNLKVLLAAAVAVVGFAGAAQAADDWRSGLYVKGAVAITKADKQHYKNDTTKVDAKLKSGYAISGAVGYEFAPALRGEVEITHRNNDVKSIDVNGVEQIARAGHTASTAYMFNGYYDIDTGTAYTPYLGAGLGVAHVNAKSNVPGSIISVTGSDTVFAYQAMAGLEYELDTNFGIYGEYRYFSSRKARVKDSLGGKHRVGNDVHNFGLGLRYKFD